MTPDTKKLIDDIRARLAWDTLLSDHAPLPYQSANKLTVGEARRAVEDIEQMEKGEPLAGIILEQFTREHGEWKRQLATERAAAHEKELRLVREIHAERAERDAVDGRYEFAAQFYAVRWERLKSLIKENAPHIWHEAAAIMANGTATVTEPPTYDQQINLLRHQLAAERAKNEQLTQRLLTAAGDDLCRLTLDEVKDLSAGKVPIPPKEEFLASCERFHAQVASEAGVNENCLTLAQLVAENARLEQERDEIQQLADSRGNLNTRLLAKWSEAKQLWQREIDNAKAERDEAVAKRREESKRTSACVDMAAELRDRCDGLRAKVAELEADYGHLQQAYLDQIDATAGGLDERLAPLVEWLESEAADESFSDDSQLYARWERADGLDCLMRAGQLRAAVAALRELAQRPAVGELSSDRLLQLAAIHKPPPEYFDDNMDEAVTELFGVGESTRNEIEHAKKLGKPIRYWNDERPDWTEPKEQPRPDVPAEVSQDVAAVESLVEITKRRSSFLAGHGTTYHDLAAAHIAWPRLKAFIEAATIGAKQ